SSRRMNDSAFDGPGLLELRDDLRGFREAPSFQRLRADVPELSELEEHLHCDVVVRRLRHADEVIFAHRVEDLHLRSELARKSRRGVRPLRRFFYVLDPLVRPIQKADVVWHDLILAREVCRHMYLMRPFGSLFPPPTRSAVESSRLRRATRVPALRIGTYGSLKDVHPVSEFEERRWSGFTLRGWPMCCSHGG